MSNRFKIELSERLSRFILYNCRTIDHPYFIGPTWAKYRINEILREVGLTTFR